MRLTCPQCAAQYEVDAEMIPQSGRDVQCSACHHIWHQAPEGLLSFVAEANSTPHPAPGTRFADDDDDDDYDDDDGPLPPLDEAALARRRKALDERLLAILREEADRETAARRRDGQTEADVRPLPDAAAEDGPDRDLAPIGDDADADTAMQPTMPIPAPAGHADATDGAEAPFIASRRGLLPDIEQIHSALDGTRDAEAAAAQARRDRARGRRGFVAGLVLVIVIAAAGIFGYLEAARLAADYPEAAPLLGQYVQSVDMARAWVQSWSAR